MRVKKILTLFLFSFFIISALLSGCSPSPQSQSSSKTDAPQNKQETGITGSYSVTDLTGTKVTLPSNRFLFGNRFNRNQSYFSLKTEKNPDVRHVYGSNRIGVGHQRPSGRH